VNAPRVLLVDDEASLRDALAEMLTYEGFRATQAGSVNEALDAFEPFAFDAVVTDLRLPDGSGLELLERLRARDPQFAAIVTSGHGCFEDAVTAISLRATAFLTKPFSLADLSRSIRAAIPGLSATEEAPAAARFTAPSDRAAELRPRLAAALTELGVHRDVAARALSLASEALDNAARHAYPAAPGPVTLTAGLDDGSLVLTVRDAGIGLDLARAVRRGRGIPRCFGEADEARIRGAKGTTVYLRFRDALREPAPDRSNLEDAAATALLWT
jgi:DNA-binding response OmpR family regulator